MRRQIGRVALPRNSTPSGQAPLPPHISDNRRSGSSNAYADKADGSFLGVGELWRCERDKESLGGGPGRSCLHAPRKRLARRRLGGDDSDLLRTGLAQERCVRVGALPLGTCVGLHGRRLASRCAKRKTWPCRRSTRLKNASLTRRPSAKRSSGPTTKACGLLVEAARRDAPPNRELALGFRLTLFCLSHGPGS